MGLISITPGDSKLVFTYDRGGVPSDHDRFEYRVYYLNSSRVWTAVIGWTTILSSNNSARTKTTSGLSNGVLHNLTIRTYRRRAAIDQQKYTRQNYNVYIGDIPVPTYPAGGPLTSGASVPFSQWTIPLPIESFHNITPNKLNIFLKNNLTYLRYQQNRQSASIRTAAMVLYWPLPLTNSVVGSNTRSNVWKTIQFNLLSSPHNIFTLSNNQISISAAGNYEFEFWFPAAFVESIRLQNITAGETVGIQFANDGDATFGVWLSCRISISGPTQFELQGIKLGRVSFAYGYSITERPAYALNIRKV